MKERPILFKGEMVRAILDGRKTQTRRVVKPQPNGVDSFEDCPTYPGEFIPWKDGEPHHSIVCPHGDPGDRLWVRETFCVGYDLSDSHVPISPETVWFRATTPDLAWIDRDTDCTVNPPWKPSIHMPRKLSRITLEITDIRVERLNDISEEDAVAEGCECYGWKPSFNNPDNAGGEPSGPPSDSFAELWESINGDGSWDANPWVWVVGFKRITP